MKHLSEEVPDVPHCYNKIPEIHSARVVQTNAHLGVPHHRATAPLPLLFIALVLQRTATVPGACPSGAKMVEQWKAQTVENKNFCRCFISPYPNTHRHVHPKCIKLLHSLTKPPKKDAQDKTRCGALSRPANAIIKECYTASTKLGEFHHLLNSSWRLAAKKTWTARRGNHVLPPEKQCCTPFCFFVPKGIPWTSHGCRAGV